MEWNPREKLRDGMEETIIFEISLALDKIAEDVPRRGFLAIQGDAKAPRTDVINALLYGVCSQAVGKMHLIRMGTRVKGSRRKRTIREATGPRRRQRKSKEIRLARHHTE